MEESFGFSDGVAVAAVLLLLLLAVLMAAAEEALSRFSVVRAESLREQEPRRADRLVALLTEPEATRNPLRLIIVTAQLLQVVLVALLASWFVSGIWVAVIVGAHIVLMFVLAEAVPRTLAILHTERVALMAAAPVGLLLRLAPVRFLARTLIGVTNWIVPGTGLQAGPFAMPEELLALADAAVEDAVIEQTERDLIVSVIEFGDTIVREVMVPRTDMLTIERSLTVAEALEVTSKAGYSRAPAIGDSVDDVVGLVYVKDLIRAELDGRPNFVESLLRSTVFVPETKRVADLLTEMQAQKFHMAVAVDEYGGIAGLVTLEDLIEELVGEIVDEYDVEEPLLENLIDGSIRVDARILIDELNDKASIELPEGDWDTVGGLAFDTFGRVPTAGDECEVDGYRLRAEQVDGRRITKVLISQREPATSQDHGE